MVTIDRRTIPEAATESRWQTADGTRVRRIDWHAEPYRGSMLFMPGRGDIYEKYLETLHGFWNDGWNVTACDWRGQGGSGRMGGGWSGRVRPGRAGVGQVACRGRRLGFAPFLFTLKGARVAAANARDEQEEEQQQES